MTASPWRSRSSARSPGTRLGSRPPGRRYSGRIRPGRTARGVAVGQECRHGQGGAGVLGHVAVLHGEELVPVGDPPQLGAGRVDQPVVGEQPLFVERAVQDPYRLGARSALAGEPPGAGGLSRKRRHRRPRGTQTGGPKQPFALGGLRPDQPLPTGPERTGVRGPHPGTPGPQRSYGPWHEVVEQRAVVAPMRLRRPPVLPPCRPPRRHRLRHRNGVGGRGVSALPRSPRRRTGRPGSGSVPHPPPGRSRRTSPPCRTGSGSAAGPGGVRRSPGPRGAPRPCR